MVKATTTRKKVKLRRAVAKKKADDRTISRQIYKSNELTLVVGDGDFSFSKALVLHRGGSGCGLFATSLDSENIVKKKYSNAHECIAAIRKRKGVVLHGVDATRLHELPTEPTQVPSTDKGHRKCLTPRFFQYIIFNFPHTGKQRVHINRALLSDFFESARPRLLRHGEVHVTLKNRPPYSNWNVEEQAQANGFVLKKRCAFNSGLFPGYQHRTTDPLAKRFEAELCVTYVFVVNRSKFPFDDSIPCTQLKIEKIANQKSVKSSEPQKTKTSAHCRLRWMWWRPLHLPRIRVYKLQQTELSLPHYHGLRTVHTTKAFHRANSSRY